MEKPSEIPTVKLAGEEGNAFAIMGKVSKALRKAGADKEYIDKYIAESISGNYWHSLGVAREYVDII